MSITYSLSLLLLFLLILQVLCFSKVRSEIHRIQEVEGISRDIQVLCMNNIDSCSGGFFWIIADSVYGLLHLPKEFVVCSIEQYCNLNDLSIPVIMREMNGFTFQCASIDYSSYTDRLGTRTELTVIPWPMNNSKKCFLNIASQLLNDISTDTLVNRNVVEFDYTLMSIGVVNTTIVGLAI